jgi:pimeloyl-ACP methyl ester carboxylesterase
MTLAAAPSFAAQKPAIVLVHGAFADATSWSKIIPALEKDGYFVTAVQIPLTSLPDDVATAKRVIDAQKGPVVVVGHSYAGAVITDAAAGNPNVKSLVYVNAFAPDAGETVAEAGNKFSLPPLNSTLAPDAAGFLYVDQAKMHDVFCKDIPAADARIIAAVQKPLHKSVFDAKVVNVAR